MQLSAEIRWFWRGTPPPGLENWFTSSEHHAYGAGGGSPEPREDRYLRDTNQLELGIKIRGNSETAGTEVKGLVVAALGDLTTRSFTGPIELWSKWISTPLSLRPGSTVAIQKWRWLRKFDTAGSSPVEVELGVDERAKGSAPLLARGCNVELTRIHVPANGQDWWTLGFESFGTIHTVESDLRAVAAVLDARQPPQLEGGLLASYPAWLKERVLPALIDPSDQKLKIEHSLWFRMRKRFPFRSQSHSRLANSLTAFDHTLGALAEHVERGVASRHQWMDTTHDLLEEVRCALNDNDPERGWQCFLAAQRTFLLGLGERDRTAKAQAILLEARVKLRSWRKDAVEGLLAKDGKIVPGTDAFTVLLANQILDEHFTNEYQKTRGIQLQTRLLCLIAVAAVLILLLFQACVQTDLAGAYPNLDAKAKLAFQCSVILYGVLGAAISGILSLANKAEKRIPELLLLFSTTFARVSVGAAAAFVMVTFLRAELLNFDSTAGSAGWLLLALSFVAGFSERLLVRAVEAVNPSG